MFLSVVIVASISGGMIRVEHPEMAFKTSAIFGKPSTPTPEGVYLVEKAYSTRLKSNMLVFRREDDAVFAIHPVVDVKGQNRRVRLETPGVADNRISGGCINISQAAFDKLWSVKSPIVLQVHGG